jgi:hypothetical protein
VHSTPSRRNFLEPLARVLYESEHCVSDLISCGLIGSDPAVPCIAPAGRLSRNERYHHQLDSSRFPSIGLGGVVFEPIRDAKPELRADWRRGIGVCASPARSSSTVPNWAYLITTDARHLESVEVLFASERDPTVRSHAAGVISRYGGSGGPPSPPNSTIACSVQRQPFPSAVVESDVEQMDRLLTRRHEERGLGPRRRYGVLSDKATTRSDRNERLIGRNALAA